MRQERGQHEWPREDAQILVHVSTLSAPMSSSLLGLEAGLTMAPWAPPVPPGSFAERWLEPSRAGSSVTRVSVLALSLACLGLLALVQIPAPLHPPGSLACLRQWGRGSLRGCVLGCRAAGFLLVCCRLWWLGGVFFWGPQHPQTALPTHSSRPPVSLCPLSPFPQTPLASHGPEPHLWIRAV